MQELFITDNHIHIDLKRGEGLKAAKKFYNSGGRCMILVNKLVKDIGLEPNSTENFERLYNFTIKTAKKIMENTKIKVFVVLGVHPAELYYMFTKYGNRGIEIAKESLILASKKVENGEAIAIGEVGFPHFEAPKKFMEICADFLKFSLEVAKDAGCAVQLHTQSLNKKGYKYLAELAKSVGFDTKKLVKHFANPYIRLCEKLGIMPSIIASEKNVKKALLEGKRFLMESDYIDDPKKPGAVTGPRSVPRITIKLYKHGLLSEEDIEKIHRDYIAKTYDIDLS